MTAAPSHQAAKKHVWRSPLCPPVVRHSSLRKLDVTDRAPPALSNVKSDTQDQHVR